MRYLIRAVDRLCVVALLASVAASCFADEPATKVEVPSGYEDAAEAGKVPAAPVRDWSELGQFGKVAAILDEKVEANVESGEKRYLSRFQQLVKVECSFLLRACELNSVQQRRIAELSGLCAKVAARQYAMARYGHAVAHGEQVGLGLGPAPRINFEPGRVMPAAARPVPPSIAQARKDPKGAVSRLLMAAVGDLLAPWQKERYAAENRKRQDHFKRSIVMDFVVLLDETLILSADQRKQLSESLWKNWNLNWVGTASYLMRSSNGYLPRIEDKHIVPFLSKKQKVVWRNCRKIDASSSSFAIGHTPEIIEDNFGDMGVIKIEGAIRGQVVPGAIRVINRQ